MSDDGTTLTTDTDGRESRVDGVRTYRGRRLEDILPRIREELGPDAVILSEREGLVGGFGGFFAQRLIEVQARGGSGIDVYDEDGEDELAAAQPPGRADATDEFMTALRRAASAWSEEADVDEDIDPHVPGSAQEDIDPHVPGSAQDAVTSADIRPASFPRVPAPPAEADEPAPFPGAMLAAAVRPALPRPEPPSSKPRPVDPLQAAEPTEPAPAAEPGEPSLDTPGREGHGGRSVDQDPTVGEEPAPVDATDGLLRAPDGPAAAGLQSTPAKLTRKARTSQKTAKVTSRSSRKPKGAGAATSAAKPGAKTRGRARATSAPPPGVAATPIGAPADAPAEQPPFVPVPASPVSPLAAQAPVSAATPPATQAPVSAATPPATQAPASAATPPASVSAATPLATEAAISALSPTPSGTGSKGPYRSRFAARTPDSERPGSSVLGRPDTQRSPAIAAPSDAPAARAARAGSAPQTSTPAASAPPAGVRPPRPPAPALPPPSGHLSPAPHARRGLRLRDAIARRLSMHANAAPSAAGARPLDTAAAATIRDEFTARGVSQSMASILIAEAAAHGSPLAPGHDLREGARAQLARRIIQPPPLPASGAAIAFVGAGGAGKTSCAAALATAYAGASTLAVSALSLGSADGGRALGELLRSSGIDVTAVEPSQAARMISERRPGGLVIVDTAAVSPGDNAAMQSLGGDLEQLPLDAVYVAVPATLGPQAARSVLASFGVLGPAGIVVTHADETDQIGVSLEIAAANRIPVAYIHAGAEPRTALIQPDPYTIAARLLP